MDRSDLVKESFVKKEVPASIPAGKTSDYYGELVFDRKKMSKYLDEVGVKTQAMKEARKAANTIEGEYDLRKPIDKLEEVVDNKLWPLPKYRELLFIS